MTHSSHLWLRALLLLLASYAIGSGVSTILKKRRERRGEKQDGTIIPAMSNKPAVLLAAGFMVGCLAGYSYRDLRQSSRMHTLRNVTIERQGPNPLEFLLRVPGEEDLVHGVFCDPVPFKAGMRFKKLKYEDKTYCWSLKDQESRYYIAQGDDDYGFDADPHTNTYAYAKPNTDAPR